MTLHYFNKENADPNDLQLRMAIQQGYVPQTCLLGGVVVMSIINESKDPCVGCECDRNKCNGRPKEVAA